MEENHYAILAKNLKKGYKGKEVLKGVDFSISEGSIYALLGSNGAGKTTTVRILTTQVKADEGSVFVKGHDIGKEQKKVHEIISLTGQFSAVDESLTGKENLILMGRLRQWKESEQKAEELLKYFELSHVADCMVSSYSGGMKRKLDIAMSLVGNPQVIFLDEPTTALDPQSRRSMWKLIRQLKSSGVTIFLTTQYLEEAEELADIIGILDRGKLIAEGTPEELKKYLPQGAVQFWFKDGEALKKAKLLVMEYETALLPEENKITIFTDGRADTLAQIFHRFYKNHLEIHDFSAAQPSLEDVFLSMLKEREENYYVDKSEKI